MRKIHVLLLLAALVFAGCGKGNEILTPSETHENNSTKRLTKIGTSIKLSTIPAVKTV